MKTTTFRYILIGLISILFSSYCYCQKSTKNPFKYSKDSIGRVFLGKEIAKEELTKFIHSPSTNLVKGRVLIKSREMLISIAEPILFEIYGKKDIISERPYEVYLLGDYWLMKGTLPSHMIGGTFTIAINRKTCEIIGITHGK